MEALNRFEEFKSTLARYVLHYIVFASSVCSHVNCWLHFFRFERLDSLLCTRILKTVIRYHDSFMDKLVIVYAYMAILDF